MKRFALFVLALCLAAPVLANDTGAPLITRTVAPCRVLDTRFALGATPNLNAEDVFVRGALLPHSSGGRPDCLVPETAEAAIVNVTVIDPTSSGVLKIDATGFLSASQVFSRINFAAGQKISNEMTVSLCNVFLYPHPHAACPLDGAGRFLDFQIIPVMAAGASTHVVVDVVGYLERMPD